MSRQQGIFTFTKNFEVRNAAPLDARMRIPYYSGLTDNSTIPYPYNGMLVSVISDSNSARNGLYFLQDKGTSTTASTTASTWSIVGGTSITGGTLNLTGGTIDFSGATTGFTVNNINFVTGFTVSNNSISGSTNTGNQYGGVFTAITAGTYSNGTISLSGSGSFLNTINGFNVLSGTGVNSTYNTNGILLDPVNQILQIQLNNGTFISANTAAFTSDNYVYSGTYNSSTGVVTFYPVTGGSFTVGGWPIGLANYYTTGSTYSPSSGSITFNRTDTQPAYSATGFNYITGFTIYSNNTLSGVTNTGQTINGGTINAVTGGTLVGDTLYFSGTGNFLSGITGFGTLQNAEYLTGGTVYSNNTISGITNSGSSRNFGQVNAVTGGTLVGDTLYFSGTGNFLSGITGFGTGSAVVTGGTNNFITKWSGTSALTISQIYDDGSNVGIGITGAGLTNKLTVSASTDPVKLIGVQQSVSPIPSTKFLAWNDSTGVVSWNNVTPQTGITIYVTGFTSSLFTNGLNPFVDFIPSGTTDNYRGVSYQYLITANSFPTTRMGTLQGLWTSGASPFVSYSDVGPTQITDGTNTIINSIYLSAVTGGIRVVVNCGGGDYTFKAYKVLL
jgi:hypothetical protein